MSTDAHDWRVAVEVGDGVVTVVVQDGRPEIGGPKITATVRRSDEAEVVSYIPIGTRDPAQLSMLIDGEPVDLAPGPGRYTRGSFHVTAVHRDVTYQLRPSSEVSSRLLRAGVVIGEFSRIRGTEIKAWWEPGVTVDAVTAAVGYALCASFGTGAKSLLGALLDGSTDLPSKVIARPTQESG